MEHDGLMSFSELTSALAAINLPDGIHLSGVKENLEILQHRAFSGVGTGNGDALLSGRSELHYVADTLFTRKSDASETHLRLVSHTYQSGWYYRISAEELFKVVCSAISELV